MREFLMLAQTFDPDKHQVAGWFMSEKYDGQRCLWDGGVSRGLPKETIPWANLKKDERYQDEQIATGLWSRYGNVIHAPDWWLDKLPAKEFLDGELYLGRKQFQETRKIVSRLKGDDRWKNIKFLVFDAPSPRVLFGDGVINNPNFQITIDEGACRDFLSTSWFGIPSYQYKAMAPSLNRIKTPQWGGINNFQLAWGETEAREQLYKRLEEVSMVGGEGLMLRNPHSVWDPKRSKFLLKVKKMQDGEGKVVGYIWGEGKLEGLMGAMIVELYTGGLLKLSGFTDEERSMWDDQNKVDAFCKDLWPAGERCAHYITNKRFPRGSMVRFRHSGLTNDGLPREARYWR